MARYTGYPNPVRRVFDWTPSTGDAGTFSIGFRATDDGAPQMQERRAVVFTIASPSSPPCILSVTPTEGLPIGGTQLTVQGIGFNSPISVHFGATSVPFVGVDGRTITFTTPPGPPGALQDVTVTTPVGVDTKVNAFQYNPNPDTDSDGIQDCVEASFGNGDGDAFPNLNDTDSDGDGIPDSAERVAPTGHPTMPVTCNSQTTSLPDTDLDGIPDFLDPDSDNDTVTDFVEGDNDIDLPAPDSIPNYRDLDSDGDGFADNADNCIATSQASQSDVDSDGRGDDCDNCPDVPNPAQGLVAFGQQIQAIDISTFAWPSPLDITFVRGQLSGVSTYEHDPPQALSAASQLVDLAIPPAGVGWYYLVKRGGSCRAGSWQTVVGAEPARDAALP